MTNRPPAYPLDAPLSALRGVGAERVAQLARLKLHTTGGLLLHRPRRYEDRTRLRPIADLALGQPAAARGKIVALGTKRWRGGSKSVFEFILEDGTARLHCRWWNLPFMEKYFHPGDEVLVYGRPVSLKPRTLDHPETEMVDLPHPGPEAFHLQVEELPGGVALLGDESLHGRLEKYLPSTSPTCSSSPPTPSPTARRSSAVSAG